MTPEPVRVPPPPKIPEPIARLIVGMNVVTSELAAVVRDLRAPPQEQPNGKAT